MSLRVRHAVFLIPFVALGVAALTQAKDPFADVRLETTKARGSVHMIKGAGGNIGVSIGKDGVFLIDDQFAPLTDKILAAVRALSNEPVRFVLNTHWHRDHVGGNERLGKAGAVLVAHEKVRARMSAEQFDAFWIRKTPPAAPGALPLVTFSDKVTFHINGDTVEVMHVPNAHTDGDSVIFFAKANVVHTGDVFFNGLYPFIDRSAGGDLDGVIAAAGAIAARIDDETIIIPGHGPIGRKKDLIAYQAMLKAVRDRIAKGIAGGKSLQKIQASKPTRDYDAVWGKTAFISPDRWVAMIYPMLGGK